MSRFFLIVILFGTSFVLSAQQLQGKVVNIADGDSFTLLTDGKMQVRIRMHGIDAPEKGQPYSQVSKQFLNSLLVNQKVNVEVRNKDRYRRVVGMVYVNGKNINEIMIAEGYAWHYLKYDKNKAWISLQEKAKIEKKGLWKDNHPIEPWNYRKIKKSK